MQPHRPSHWSLPTKPPKLAPIAGRPPPQNLDAEAAVISACLLSPAKIEQVAGILRKADFHSDANAEIFAVLVKLRAEQQKIDVVTVANVLREKERLATIGGAAYLAQITDATPHVGNVEAHAQIVAELAQRRRVISQAQLVVAEGYGPVAPDWVQTSVRALSDAADVRAPRGAVHAAWSSLALDLLTTQPQPRRWLLRHPTRNGAECAPGQGDGMLPLGKAGLLSSEGGVGKTMALAQLAMSVALGLPWLGHFDVATEATGGRVLLALAEEDLEEVHRRLYAAAEALDLTEEQRNRVAERVVVLPLAGRPVTLVAPSADGSTIDVTDEHRALVQRLVADAGELGWRLIVLDPLARWAGADTESDNAAATRFVQAVESLTEVPGRPAVIVAHHSSKMARRESKADARGVTAITDGFRWASTLRSHNGKVLFAQTKSNYSRPMPEELELQRGNGGVLRVPTENEEAEQRGRAENRTDEREAKATDAEERKIAAMMRHVVDTVRRAKIPLTSRKDLNALLSGRQPIKVAAITRLANEGRLVKLKEGYRVVEPPPAPSNAGANGQPSLF